MSSANLFCLEMLAQPKRKYINPRYGQAVIGPPGSGKSTYCHRMHSFLSRLDRKVCVINLDPANENMTYTAEINIMNLITVEDVMSHLGLGPNGALMYCLEYLEANIEWLLKNLEALPYDYFILDCPGQVELYTHHKSISRIFERLQSCSYHLCAVQLIDSHYCSDPAKFISTLLMSLNSMLLMGLPHVNLLSKADLLKQFESKLLYNLEFYTDVLDLSYLLEALDDAPGMRKYKKLNAAIISMVEDYALVSFQPLDVHRDESLLRVKNLVDKANGYIYGAGEERSINSLLACAVGAESHQDKIEKDINLNKFSLY